MKASDQGRNAYYTPIYLKKAALVYEQLQLYENAMDCYSEIIEDFKQSTEVIAAKRERARLVAMIES